MAECWKRAYNSWIAAEAIALVTMEANRDGTSNHPKGGSLFAYMCETCNLWHVGHMGPSRPKQVTFHAG